MDVIEINNNCDELKKFLSKIESKIYHTDYYGKFVQEAFNTNYKLISVVKDKEIKTILPITEVRSKIFGNKIISTAYLEYGGFCGDKENINKIIKFLNQKYKKNNRYLEIRGGCEEFDQELSKITIKKNLYKRFVLKLENEDIIWRKIQKSKRKAIKKSLKCLEVKDIPESDLNMLHRLYCKNMKNFGSPPYSKKYFKSFYKNLVKNNFGKIFGAYHKNKLVSFLLGTCYKDRVHIIIAVSDKKYQQYRPNDAVHWTFIKWACENNCKYFDFGRVREDSGQYEYKRKWGPKLMELPSYFILWKEKEIPIVDPKRHQMLVNIWKKLPTVITKLFGPRLRKELGI
jgi:FemAB-related protein (PEP-CTERM system-associated)